MSFIERKNLIHQFLMSDHDFMVEIDKTGGWPQEYKFVQFYHGEDRTCRFTNNQINTGWWTTVCSADDYFWWKISKEKKDEIFKTARMQLISQLR